MNEQECLMALKYSIELYEWFWMNVFVLVDCVRVCVRDNIRKFWYGLIQFLWEEGKISQALIVHEANIIGKHTHIHTQTLLKILSIVIYSHWQSFFLIAFLSQLFVSFCFLSIHFLIRSFFKYRTHRERTVKLNTYFDHFALVEIRI